MRTAVRRVRNAVMKDLGLPEDMLTFVNYPTRFDRRETDAALKGSGIECPNLHDYAWRLWDYWERHLDPALFIDRSLKGTVAGKVVLVTGGSSGIGLAAACKFAQAGAITIICARDNDKLAEAVKEIRAFAGKEAQVHSYSVDIADEADCAAFIQKLSGDRWIQVSNQKTATGATSPQLAPVVSVTPSPTPAAVAQDDGGELDKGTAALKARRFEAAKAAFTKAVERVPANADAHAGLAHALYELQSAAAAQAEAKKALDLGPSNARANLVLGLIAYDRQKNQEAGGYLKRYLELAPSGEHAADVKMILKSL